MAILPHEQRRPRHANREAASSSEAGGQKLTIRVPPAPRPLAIIGRRYWSRRIIDKAGGVSLPTFGSPQWHALSDGDPVKVAAVVIAAECWAQAGDTLEDDLRREVEDSRRAYQAAEDEDYRQRAAAHRRNARAVNVLPFAARRQAQLDAAAPRDGDHRGGPVEWSGDSA